MGRLAAGIACLLAAIVGQPAAAQRLDGDRAAVHPNPSSADSIKFADGDLGVSNGMRAMPPRGLAPLRPFAPVVSAVMPGAGQALLGNDRFIAYAAVEVLSWWKYRKDSREQGAQERAYKELARRVGRSNFSATLPDGDWTYYEAMRDRLESGVYSKSLVGPVQPETDTSTYNGYQWDLALRTNPDVGSALAQYERFAIKPEYRWSWYNAQLQWDIFKRTTFKRDDAYYATVQDLIVIGANHVISMVDAFATVRLEVRTDGNGRTKLGARVPW